jgi:phosphate transport system substrate-binding protein
MKPIHALLAAAAAALSLAAAFAGEVTGAGATFPYPVYKKWAEAYRAETGATIAYQAVGSGLGIKLVQQKSVTFGASDMPLKPEMLAKSGLVQFPTVVGGAVPVVNVPGLATGTMVLDGPTLAAIFLGKITRWNAPAIAHLNPDMALPGLPITVFHRADGSGTTFIWADYLSKKNAEWRANVGAATTIDWPAGIGANGNEGVADAVARTAGAIGYVEYTYAVQHELNFTRLFNKEGVAVAPSLESFRAAAAGADWSPSTKFYVVLTDQPGAASWPIAGASFILMQKKPQDAAASAEALKFFKWAYAKGADMALELHYVPLPPEAARKVEESWKEIR